MPYPTNADLPASVQEHLPAHAQDIFRAGTSITLLRRTRVIRARRRQLIGIPWAAVKRCYVKVGNDWISRADSQM